MRYCAYTLVAGMLIMLAACGGSAPTGGVQPTQPAPTSSAPAPPTAQPTAAPAPAPSTAAPAPAATVVPGGNATPGAPALTPSGQPDTGAGDGILVVYHKSGGIAGVDETLTIYADGRVVLQTRSGQEKTAQIADSEIDPLLTLLSSAEFAALKPQYRAPGADQITYEIKLPGGPTITTMDGAQNPTVLNEVLQALEQLSRRI
jgi:hypothetical protein